MFDTFAVPMFQGTIGEVTKSKLAKYENSRTFAIVFDRLVNMALDYRYDFDGLPDTMDDRVIKQSLLFYGSVVPFSIGSTNIALTGMNDGKVIDIFGNPRSAYIFSRNGKLNKNVNLHYKYDTDKIEEFNLGVLDNSLDLITDSEFDNGVMVWETKSRKPFIWKVIYFAEQIADSYRTLQMDRRWLKRPFIPRCEESEAKSFDESLKKFMNNEDFTVSLHSHNIDKTDIFAVDIPATLCTSVTQLIEWYENTFKILCGIDSNSQVDKKGENLVVDEIHQNSEYAQFNIDSVINEMNKQWEVYNKLASTNIKAVPPKTKQEQEKKEEEAQKAFSEKENGNGKDNDVRGNSKSES